MPRVLVDVSQRELSTWILGERIAFPVCIASTAMHRMAHPEGEVATAQGITLILELIYYLLLLTSLYEREHKPW